LEFLKIKIKENFTGRKSKGEKKGFLTFLSYKKDLKERW
jgi:hypothetical protein